MSRKPIWERRKTESELLEGLRRQIGHLRSSCAAFDAGKLAEAERIASAVYIICHDGNKNNVSALTHAKLRPKLLIPDTTSYHYRALRETGQLHCNIPMCNLWKEQDGSIRHHPFFGEPEQMDRIRFSKWWDQVVYLTAKNLRLTRKNLVYFMRSQDGGAHLDNRITSEAYAFLEAGNQPFLTKHPIYGEMYFQVAFKGLGYPKFGHWATMRQIGWELEIALTALGF